jgi:hypothetical protein
VSFDRSDISTHQELVLLPLNVRFRIEFFDLRVWAQNFKISFSCPIFFIFASVRRWKMARKFVLVRVVDPDPIRIGSGFSDCVDPDPYWESGSRIRIQGQEN